MQTLVRWYDELSTYERDADELAADSWEVSATAQFTPRTGCLRVLLIGVLWSLVFPPRPLFVVTYTRRTA